MKNLNSTNVNSEIQIQDPSVVDLNMPIYNELGDQAQSSINVLEMINNQFKQIHEMNKRRSLLLKEISQYLVK